MSPAGSPPRNCCPHRRYIRYVSCPPRSRGRGMAPENSDATEMGGHPHWQSIPESSPSQPFGSVRGRRPMQVVVRDQRGSLWVPPTGRCRSSSGLPSVVPALAEHGYRPGTEHCCGHWAAVSSEDGSWAESTCPISRGLDSAPSRYGFLDTRRITGHFAHARAARRWFEKACGPEPEIGCRTLNARQSAGAWIFVSGSDSRRSVSRR